MVFFPMVLFPVFHFLMVLLPTTVLPPTLVTALLGPENVHRLLAGLDWLPAVCKRVPALQQFLTTGIMLSEQSRCLVLIRRNKAPFF